MLLSVSPAWRSLVVTAAQAVIGAVGGSPAAPATGAALSAAGLTAFVNLAGPVIRIVEGKGAIADDETAANAVLEAVATLDPASAPVIAMIQMAEPAFLAIVGLVQSGAIRGGYPDIGGEEASKNFKNR